MTLDLKLKEVEALKVLVRNGQSHHDILIATRAEVILKEILKWENRIEQEAQSSANSDMFDRYGGYTGI